jgi:hypothetical protein
VRIAGLFLVVMAALGVAACGGASDPASKARELLCERSAGDAMTVYRLPAIHELRATGSSQRLSVVEWADEAQTTQVGFDQVGRARCEELEVIGREDSKFTPYWFNVRSTGTPQLEGWVFANVSLVAESSELEAVESLPVSTPSPSHPDGTPDLLFGSVEERSLLGERCDPRFPFETVSGILTVAVENAGGATSPSVFDIEIGDEQELETVQLSRGIEPGEQLLLYPPGGTNLAIDPNDEIDEADDENNSVHVQTPREYVCR